MEQAESLLSVSLDSFPGKLWWLVNDPHIRSVTWDALGKGLLVDEKLFASEVLASESASDPGLAGNGVAGGLELFKTKSFTSFIRQLNLYGFRKVSKEVVLGQMSAPRGTSAPGQGAGHGSPDKPSRFVHHFCNPHFLRDHPELLIHLKRLTKANKAKLLEGKSLPSRVQYLPNRALQGGLLSASCMSAEATGTAPVELLAVEEPPPQPSGQDFVTYCPAGTSPQVQYISPTTSLDNAPVFSMVWQDFSTQVMYTVQPVTSILPLEQWAQASVPSRGQYSSPAPEQHPLNYYPAAGLPCCSADPLPQHADPAASPQAPCSFFQNNTPFASDFTTSQPEEENPTAFPEPYNSPEEEKGLPVRPTCRKRAREDESPDHLLEGRPNKKVCFPKEETGE